MNIICNKKDNENSLMYSPHLWAEDYSNIMCCLDQHIHIYLRNFLLLADKNQNYESLGLYNIYN